MLSLLVTMMPCARLHSLEYPHLDATALRASPRLDAGPPARYFTQLRDHLSANDTTTWQQAYYVNDTFFTGDGPVFLCVGGEGPPIDGSAVTHSVHCNNAVEFLQASKALMFAVEHRYYGCHNSSACPYTEKDPKPLRWLSSRQALADLAAFHAYATRAYGLTSKNKWVSFGGSYPGMLAGWFRVMYPELVHAAVSSSAPVRAKLEMTEYFDIAARAYSLESVGGSPGCEAAIRHGHESIASLWSTADGRKQLASKFKRVAAQGAEWLANRTGRTEFAGNGVIYFPSQGNDPACTAYACNIEQICNVMVAGQEPLTSLATLANAAFEAAAARGAAKASTPASVGSAARPLHEELDYWGYQTCTEFGFYQTCDIGSQCFFVQGYNRLSDDDAFCLRDYGRSPADIQASIDATNAYYGSLRPDLAHNASRVLYVNGDVDPWSGLSILTSPSPQLPTMIVPGASHHAWTHPSASTDQPSVVRARGLIRIQVAKWLAMN